MGTARSRPSFFTLDVQRRALELRAAEFAQGRSACFLLFDRAAGDAAVIGRLNFTQIVRGVFHAAIVGYAIDRDYEGRGYMTEALGAALQWAFNELRLHRVMASYRPENARSARVLEKLGFEREGFARDYLYIDGGWTDHVLTALTNPRPEIVRSSRRRARMAVVRVEHPMLADARANFERATRGAARVSRAHGDELGAFLAYEATRLLATRPRRNCDPARHRPRDADSRGKPVVAPIMRAGLGLLDAFLTVVPSATVADLGFFRDPTTLAAVPYYANLPDDLAAAPVFVLDPMLATGNSAKAALDVLASHGAQAMTFVCVIAAPEGMRSWSARPSLGADRRRRERRAPGRARLHRAGAGRRGRPALRKRRLAAGVVSRGPRALNPASIGAPFDERR